MKFGPVIIYKLYLWGPDVLAQKWMPWLIDYRQNVLIVFGFGAD